MAQPGLHVELFVDPAIAVEGIASSGLLGAQADTLAAVEPTMNDLVALTKSKDGPLCAIATASLAAARTS